MNISTACDLQKDLTFDGLKKYIQLIEVQSSQ